MEIKYLLGKKFFFQIISVPGPACVEFGGIKPSGLLVACVPLHQTNSRAPPRPPPLAMGGGAG